VIRHTKIFTEEGGGKSEVVSQKEAGGRFKAQEVSCEGTGGKVQCCRNWGQREKRNRGGREKEKHPKGTVPKKKHKLEGEGDLYERSGKVEEGGGGIKLGAHKRVKTVGTSITQTCTPEISKRGG